MTLEWKDDPFVKAQNIIYLSKDLQYLAVMSWIIVFANTFFILGFGLLLGYANGVVRSSYISEGTVRFSTGALSFTSGYFAGVVILSLSLLVLFVMGIILLTVRKPYFQDQGLVAANGVISILGGLFIVSGVLSLVIIRKINAQNRALPTAPPPFVGPPAAPSDPSGRISTGT